MVAAEKQFCRHGHDTYIIGRSPIGRCKECNRIRTRKSYLKHKTKKSYQSRLRKNLVRYGITPEQYDKLFIQQNGNCGICQKPQNNYKRRLSVDHDHKTGQVRGLLCVKCNLTLGLINDSPQILEAAIKYLSLI